MTTYAEAMSIILKKIEKLIRQTEEDMNKIELKLGYVPIEVQNENYKAIKEVIKMIDKDEIAERFFLEYKCEFPFAYEKETIDSYKKMAELLTR